MGSAGAADPAARMRQLLSALVERLELQPIGPDRFRASSEEDRHGRIYGGQVVSQALSAAFRTLPGWSSPAPSGPRVPPAHSLHAYFLLPGNPALPLVFGVERLRDGRSFATRRVTVFQRERPIFEMLASFHAPEPGYEHALAMPEVPPPEELPAPHELLEAMRERIPEETRWVRHPRPIEARYAVVPTHIGGEASDGPNFVWLRAPAALPDDPVLHQCLLAYASDLSFNDNALRRHGRAGPLGRNMMASLDHVLWFHQPARTDEWLLFQQTSPRAGAGRGLVAGAIFSRDGRHVASVGQETLLRPLARPPGAPDSRSSSPSR